MPQFHQGDPEAKLFIGRVHYDLEEDGIRAEIAKWNQPVKYIWVPGKRGSCHIEFETKKAKEAFLKDKSLHYMAGRMVDVKDFDSRMIQNASTVEPIKVSSKKKNATSGLGLASIQHKQQAVALTPAPAPSTNAWAAGRPGVNPARPGARGSLTSSGNSPLSSTSSSPAFGDFGALPMPSLRPGLDEGGEGAVHVGVVAEYLGGDFGLIQHERLGKGFFANEGVLVCSQHKLMCKALGCPYYRRYKSADHGFKPLLELLQPGSMVNFRLVTRRDHIDYSFQASMVWPSLSAEPSVLEELSSAAMNAQYARVKALDYGERPVLPSLSTFGGLGGLGGFYGDRSLSNVRPTSLEESLQSFSFGDITPSLPDSRSSPVASSSSSSSAIISDLENMLDSIEKIRDFIKDQLDVSKIEEKVVTKLARTVLGTVGKEEDLKRTVADFMEANEVSLKPGKKETVVLANLRVLLHGLNIRKGVSLTNKPASTTPSTANSTAAELTNPSMDRASSTLMSIISQGAANRNTLSLSGRSTPTHKPELSKNRSPSSASSAPTTPSRPKLASKQNEKVVVKIKNEANNDIWEVPTDDKGRLGKDMLASVFPGIKALKFKNELTGVTRIINLNGEFYEAPSDGWGDRVYEPHIQPLATPTLNQQEKAKKPVATTTPVVASGATVPPSGFVGSFMAPPPATAVNYQDQLFQQFFQRELIARGLAPPPNGSWYYGSNRSGYNGYTNPPY